MKDTNILSNDTLFKCEKRKKTSTHDLHIPFQDSPLFECKVNNVKMN